MMPELPIPRRNRLTRIASIDERRNPELPAMVRRTMEATRILIFPILSEGHQESFP